jgi:polyhydroxyalkanoate synthesis regulator phasin
MTDTPLKNEQRTYTEQEVFEILRRYQMEEQAITQRVREERDLPLQITSALDEVTKQQHQENFKRYRRKISKYHHEEWTVAEEINEGFLPKLKQSSVDTTQVTTAYYKGAENSRLHGRAATELFEQLLTIKSGELSADEAKQLLDEALEGARRLAIHAWVQAKQADEDAKEYATRALKHPQITPFFLRNSTLTRRNPLQSNQRQWQIGSKQPWTRQRYTPTTVNNTPYEQYTVKKR